MPEDSPVVDFVCPFSWPGESGIESIFETEAGLESVQ